METHFKVAGAIMILLALIHLFFPRYFKWKENLSSLSLINRQMMLVHTFFIAIVVFLIGLLSLFLSEDMVGTKFGGIISLGFALFWIARLFVQFFVYSSELWKGKKFETTIHIVFALLWTYLSGVFITNFLNWA